MHNYQEKHYDNCCFSRFVESEFGVPHAHENKLWNRFKIP